jgi:hypothetical protein
MRSPRKLATVALAVSVLSGAIGVAGASADTATQTVTGTIANSIAVDLSQPDLTANLVVGENTVPGGSLTVSANVLTNVTAAFDQTAMTEWDGTAYVTAGNQLSSPLTLTALSGGVSVGTATSTTDGVLISSSPLGDSVFDLSYNQPVLIDDPAGTYRIGVTFTASALG